ncbi:MAG: DUF4271 domain-containing protein [Bacteroidaceae bacterium]|nr:DUF4271 domain-containing protein [Bacteroidaceae bacterium]
MIQDTIVVNNAHVAADTVMQPHVSHGPEAREVAIGAEPAADSATVATTVVTQREAEQPDSLIALPDSIAEPADTAALPAVSLPLLYRGDQSLDSLLARDSLLFSSSRVAPGHGVGMTAQALPPALFRNDGVSIALLSCFILTLLYLAGSRRNLRERLYNFFRPKPATASASAAEAETYEWVHLLLGLQLSLIASLLFYSFAVERLSASLINLPPLALVGIYAAVFMLMLIAKQRLYHFVHATFFTESERRRWYESFSLLFIFESLVLFPLALLSVYFDLGLEKVSIILAAVLLFVKILLFFKCFSVFFGKLKGCLHLILYFCALELLPLLFTGGALTELTRLFITIF